MTVTTKALVSSVILPAGTSTPYTCTVKATILDKITVFNSDTITTADISISLPLGADNLMVKTLQPQESYMCPEIAGHTLNKDQSFTIDVTTVFARNRSRALRSRTL